jgi:hypothetical protein
MDRPYGISDFVFPNRWDRETGPDVVERAGRASHTRKTCYLCGNRRFFVGYSNAP